MKLFGGDHFRKSLKDFILGRAAQAILALSFTIISVRVMNSSDYGVYIVLIGLADFIRPLSSLGVLPTLQQYLPEMALHASKNQLFKFSAMMKKIRWSLLIILSLLIWVCWNWLLGYTGVTTTSKYTVYWVMLLVFGVLSLEYSEAMLEALLDQKSAQLARMLHMSIRLAGVVYLSFSQKISVDSVLLSECVASLVAIILAEIRLANALSRLTPDGSKHFTKDEIIKFAAHLSFTQVMNAFATPGILRIFVSRALGVEAAGQFGFMQTLLQQINKLMPSLLFSNLVRPMLIAARARNQLEKVSSACGLLFKINVWLVWPLIPMMLLVGDELMFLVSSGKLHHMGAEMTFMLLGLSVMTQMQVAAVVLQIHKMSGQLAWAGLLSLLAPIFVYIGSAYSVLYACVGLFFASAVRYFITMAIIQKSAAKVHLDFYGSMRYLAGLILAFYLVRFANISSTLLTVFSFALCLIVLLPLIQPVARFEYEVFKEAFKRNLPLSRYIVNRWYL